MPFPTKIFIRGKDMGDIALKFEPAASCGVVDGDVAFMLMPMKLSAMEAVNTFIELAYGKDCVCTEEPKGWLKISTLVENQSSPPQHEG